MSAWDPRLWLLVGEQIQPVVWYVVIVYFATAVGVLCRGFVFQRW